MRTIPVIFRRRIDDGVVALFPTLPGGPRGKLCKVYGPDGWGTAEYGAVISLSFPALPAAYRPIYDRLTNELHCELEVHKRASAAMHAERMRSASRK